MPVYTKQTWFDFPSTASPVNATRLNHIEDGIANTAGVFNVMNYGADPTGATDSAAAVNTAIGLLDSNRAGTIYFPQGIYLFNSNVVCTVPGTKFVGEAQTGVSDDLTKGCTQIRIADTSGWGLTLGTTASSELRGYRLENLEFYELNSGGVTGGLVRLLKSADSTFVSSAFGGCESGVGFSNDGSGGGNNQYVSFYDCRFGDCATAYDQKAANGVRMIGCYFEGAQNGAAPTSGSVGVKLNSSGGDSFRAIGTIFQGFDTLVDIGPNIGHQLIGCRLENWTTQGVIIRASSKGAVVEKCSFSNSIRSNAGTPIVLESGAISPSISAGIEGYTTLAAAISDGGATNPDIHIYSSNSGVGIMVPQKLTLGSLTGPTITAGSGSPEGAVTAPIGSRYHRIDGGTGTSTYRKESGTGNTGWVADASGGGGSLTSSTNYLSADVTMTTAGTYYDGPSLSLAAGTWLLVGQAQILGSTSASRTFSLRLWDGTTIASTAAHLTEGTAAAAQSSIPISGIVSPGSTTTYKISATSTVNSDTFRGTSTQGSYLLAVKIA